MDQPEPPVMSTLHQRGSVVLLSLLVSLFCLPVHTMAEAGTTLVITQPLHFVSADGVDVLAEAGTYETDVINSQLTLTMEGRAALRLEAKVTPHGARIGSPTAIEVNDNNPDIVHVVLFLPDGHAWDAPGWLSDIRSRGAEPVFLEKPQLDYAVLQAAPAPLTKDPRLSLPLMPPSDSHVCLQDVRQEFLKMRTHGDQLGFWQGAGFPSFGYNWPQAGSHFQGIQRARTGPYLFVSGSSDRVSHLFVVKLGSRPGSGRFRSNRLTTNLPPQQDVVIKTVDISSDYTHAGGIQVIGDVLVVGVEEGNGSKVVFYDVKNPEMPVRLPQEVLRGPGSGLPLIAGPNLSAGATGIAKRPDGRYVLLVARYNSNIIDFYLSGTTNLRSPNFLYLSTWQERELLAEQGMDREFGNYQNINLVQQCNGDLFLVGLHKNTAIMVAGEDWADLFRLDFTPVNQAVVTKVANRHMYCQYQCNFDAGAGVFVSPDRHLSIYGIEHWQHSGLIKFNEFRPVPTRVTSPLTDINQAWVELFDDVNYGDRSVIIDFSDRHSRDYRNFGGVGRIVPVTPLESVPDPLWRIDGFEDKASSIKWLLPAEWQYMLFSDKAFKGRMLPLIGSGSVQNMPTLHALGWNDIVSSSRFVKREISRTEEGWIELFDDKNFTDRRLSLYGRSDPIADYKTITVEGQRGFGDKVSSGRYQLPRGTVYRLYQDDHFGGTYRDLVGTGHVEEIPDFQALGFNDLTSSSRFIP